MPNPRPFIKAALKVGETRSLWDGFGLKYVSRLGVGDSVTPLHDAWTFELVRPDGKKHVIDIFEYAKNPGFGSTTIRFPSKEMSFMPDERTKVPLRVLLAMKREIEAALPEILAFGTEERTGGVHSRPIRGRGDWAGQTIPRSRRPFLNE